MNARPTSLAILTLAALAVLCGCGGGGTSAVGAQAPTLSIYPAAPQLAPGDTVQFTAALKAPTVAWAVAEPGGGTIDADGRYTAPETEGTYTVTATVAADLSSSTSVRVTKYVSPPVIASFTATPQGSASVLAWSVSGATSIAIDNGIGTVNGPSVTVSPSATTTYTLTAANRAGSATAAVTVTPSPPVASAPPQGTGTTYRASYITGVTGGGPMPDWTRAVTASCAGDGQTDDTSCLQAAANAARDQQKPLVVPAKSSFYRTTAPVTVYTSIGGVGGMPTIMNTNTSATWPLQKIIILAPGMSGWVYNLHLVGTFDGTNAVTEHGNQVDVGSVNGVTIKNNLFENPQGDAVSTDASAFDGGGGSQNVLVDGNTMRNPYRCAIALNYAASNWVATNNVMDKQVNFVSGIDIEPEKAGVVLHLEIAYNHFVMNNRTVNPSRGADGKAVFGWHVADPPTPTAGGDYYVHHNYGTFGTGFSGWGNGGWGYIYEASNVEGSSIPL